MLTFFRRIRKGLLGDGATSKYLIYAIGEIALVVIGILIALQINNWNQGRVLAQEIDNSLIKIKKDLINDFVAFDHQDSILGSMVSKAERIRELLLLDNNLEHLTEIRSLRLNPRNFDFFSFAFESSVNTGVLYKIDDNLMVYEISDYYRNMEDLTEIIFRFNDQISRLVTRDAMDAFNFIAMIDEEVIPNQRRTLDWMNNPDSEEFRASHVYLANYITAYNYLQRRMRDFKVLNLELTESIDVYLAK